VHSTATPCTNISSSASSQNDFTKASAWLTHATGVSMRNLTTFCGAPRSHSSKGCSPTSPSSGGSTMSTSFLAAPLRFSSSFCRRSSFSPSVLIYRRQSANCCSVSAITFCSFSTSSVRRYSIFFTSVSSTSLYVKIFLSSTVKMFSESKENC
jgi:hypothetical protein